MSIGKVGVNIDSQIKTPIKPVKSERGSLEPKDTVGRSVKDKDLGLIPKQGKEAWTSGERFGINAILKGIASVVGGGIAGAIVGGFAGASMGGPIGATVGVILGIPLGGMAGFGAVSLFS
ncbi:MAG: hypothetical protein K8T10_09715 [Candidatus Eremiobacteraeota bacterium]|nr:hypothetical protein [Candidatus Eremiobacteraeota bacterium]